ncbi:MAG TPA: hypothetical protein VMV23_02560 [Candidatus Nanopelagicaceae bacterium]|nr:hypothetical protein [Candidatus Nanopelagicaceae bacterium]
MTDHAPTTRRRPALAGALFALVLGCLGAVSLLALSPPSQPDGLGLLPQTVTLVGRSGVMLSDPLAPPLISQAKAIAVAMGQGRQDYVQQAVLANARSLVGGPLGRHTTLCWVVLLQANPDQSGNLPAPGQINLYLVLVNARTGRFIEGVIAFQGPSHSGVGEL